MRENTFQAAYRDALQRAQNSLLSRNISACCASAGALLAQQKNYPDTIELLFLNKPVRITLPSLHFSTNTGEETISIWEQILILHYLTNSEQAITQDTLINYRRLRDGALYAEPFDRRCIQPLIQTFGNAPNELIRAAKTLGGFSADFGDYAVRIPAFPKLDIICCLWKADADFEADATILFDAGIEHYLCAEDIAVLCQQIVLQLIKNRAS